jgi:hypothetical protein
MEGMMKYFCRETFWVLIFLDFFLFFFFRSHLSIWPMPISVAAQEKGIYHAI